MKKAAVIMGSDSDLPVVENGSEGAGFAASEGGAWENSVVSF